MFVSIRLGWRELIDNRGVNLVMAQVIALSLTIFLSLHGYRTGLALEYGDVLRSFLVVQQSNSLGEVLGSRLSPQVADQLRSSGITEITPEIHAITGTSPQDMAMVRGISLDRYQQVEQFELRAGRLFSTGDPVRRTMIGQRLADARGVGPGDTISLRGRDFAVVGVFWTGTYVDNEAWISIEDAQALLGWGDDVSIYVVPDEGLVRVGDELDGGISVVRKGEAAGNYARQWAPLLEMFEAASIALSIVAAVTLANVLWRLAKLRQRELAIMRVVGFGKMSLVGYLWVQAVGIVGFGWLFGLVGVALLSSLAEVGYSGVTVSFVIDWRVLLNSLAVAGFITLGGVIGPVVWLNRLDVARLLRTE